MMTPTREASITMAAQIGGPEAGIAVKPHLVALNKFFDKYCSTRYSTEIEEFAPILRVDGDLTHYDWNIAGCQRLRLMRKRKYITIDIGMHQEHWEGKAPIEIRRYLIENLKECLQLMVTKLKKEKIEVDDKKLFEDIAKLEKEYLKTV